MSIVGCNIGSLDPRIVRHESVYRGAREVTLRIRRIERVHNYLTLQ